MTPTALRNLWKKENLKYGTGGDALWVSGTWRWLGQGPHTPRPMRGQLASIFRPIRWQENRSQKCRCFSQPPKLSTPSQIITIMCLTLLVTSLNLFFMDNNSHFSNKSKSGNIASESKMGGVGSAWDKEIAKWMVNPQWIWLPALKKGWRLRHCLWRGHKRLRFQIFTDHFFLRR